MAPRRIIPSLAAALSVVQVEAFLPRTAYELCSARCGYRTSTSTSTSTSTTNWSGNKYERLRQRLFAAAAKDDEFSAVADMCRESASPQIVAQETMAVLTRRSKTWKRLGSIVDLALNTGETFDEVVGGGPGTPLGIRTIADVGTDHGMLALALAATGRFKMVIGADLSDQALKNGALTFHKKVLDALSRDEAYNSTVPQSILPVEFRVGDGLRALKENEGDAVAIAGMGHHTMMNILSREELNRIGCTKLFLQPTNSRPRNLIMLYDYLQKYDWKLQEERIQFISKRWYISSAFTFEPTSTTYLELPGDRLKNLETEDDPQYDEFVRYIQHHRQWLERDLAVKGYLESQDRRWFDIYGESSQ